MFATLFQHKFIQLKSHHYAGNIKKVAELPLRAPTQKTREHHF